MLGMLAAPLWRNIDYRTFKEFQKTLLNAFSRYVACNRRVIAFAGYFVDLINEHDSSLGFNDIIVGSLQKSYEQTLDVFADITGFC